MKIGARLALGFGSVLLLLALLLAFALSVLGRFHADVATTVRERWPANQVANLGLDRISELGNALGRELLAPTVEAAATSRTATHRARQRLQSLLDELYRIDGGDPAVDGTRAAQAVTELLIAHAHVRTLLDSDRADAARRFMLGEWQLRQRRALEAAHALAVQQSAHIAAAAERSGRSLELQRNLLWLFAGLIALLTVAIGFRLTRSVTAPIRHAALLADRTGDGGASPGVIAAGDETVQLLDAMRRMAERLERHAQRRATAEQALRDSEQRYRLLADHATDIICSHAADFSYRHVSPASLPLLGWSPQDLVGRDPLELCVDEDRAAFSAGIAPLLQPSFGQPRIWCWRARGRDGRVRWLETVGRRIDDGQSHDAELVTVTRDISARRAADRQLDEIRTVLERSQSQALIGSWWYDFRSHELRWTEQTYAMFGLDRAARPSLDDLFDRVHEDDRAPMQASWSAAVAGTARYDCEHRAQVGGVLKWFRERAEIDRDAAGRPLLATGTVQDITEVKDKEQALLQHRQLLRELADHREQVREDERRRIAREVHDELGQYLTTLRMDTALLRMRFGALAPELSAHVATMKTTIDQTMAVVREVTAALRPGVLDEGLSAAAEWLIARFAERHDVQTRLQLPDEDLAVGDAVATAAFRILQESLTNIARHAGAGRVDIDIDIVDGRLQLRVADDGVGFDPAAVCGRGRFGLLGIGERVAALGGVLSIDAALGSGTTLWVSLPLSTMDAR